MMGPESVTVINHYDSMKKLVRKLRALDELGIHYTVETTAVGYKLTYIVYEYDGAPHTAEAA